MYKLPLLLSLAVFMLGSSVLAINNAGFSSMNGIYRAAGLPTEWYSCHGDNDCGLVQRDCGMSYAFNKAHSDKAMAAIENFCKVQQKPAFGCPIYDCAASPRPASAAMCDLGECRPVSPYKDIDEAWQACKQDDDCIKIEGDCGYARALNKDFVKQFHERGLPPGLVCTKPVEAHFGSVAKCDDAKCVLSPCGNPCIR